MYMSDRNRQRESTIHPVIVIIQARGDRYNVVNDFGGKTDGNCAKKRDSWSQEISFCGSRIITRSAAVASDAPRGLACKLCSNT